MNSASLGMPYAPYSRRSQTAQLDYDFVRFVDFLSHLFGIVPFSPIYLNHSIQPLLPLASMNEKTSKELALISFEF